MSYLSFMPWTLQRRLLRYLLSQFDFLETDDLDLEDLGIRWGQRSIVELRNVGLRTSVRLTGLRKWIKLKLSQKLSSILPLPTLVNFISARISYLKITVPANILTSGIEIDISGVNVHLKVDPKDEKGHAFTRPEQRKPPARGTKSNRPRTGTPTVHDPGGRRTAPYRPLEDSLFHPDLAVQQLAESFLQTESQEDRLELQAAIASQSRHERESISSSISSEEEVGIGATEGYTLPSFVASCLAGIADRLQLHVKDIAIHVEFEHSRDSPNSSRTRDTRSTLFLLNLSELCVQGVGPVPDDHSQGTPKRKVVLHQFSILVLPDSSSDSSDPGSAETTSPILKHSNASPLSTAMALNPVQEHGTDLTFSDSMERISDYTSGLRHPQQIDRSTTSSDSVFSDESSAALRIPAGLDNSLDDSTLFAATSQELRLSNSSDQGSPPPVRPSSTSADDVFGDHAKRDADEPLRHDQILNSRRISSPGSIDNQVYAESLAKSGQSASEMEDAISGDLPVEDLTESKIFTHDEAESMYMSALSVNLDSPGDGKQMPGAWDWAGDRACASSRSTNPELVRSSIEALPRNKPASAVSPRTPPLCLISSADPGAPGKDGSVDSVASLGQMPSTAKQLLFIDQISAWLPTTHDSDLPTTPILEQTVNDGGESRDGGNGSQVKRSSSPTGDLHAFSLNASENRSQTTDRIPYEADLTPISFNSPDTIEVEVVNVHCQFDMQTGKILVAIAKSTLGESQAATKGKNASVPSAADPRFSLKVNDLDIAFLEHVPERSIKAAVEKHFPPDDALLLHMSLAGIAYTSSVLDGALQQHFHLTKMSLSHSKGQLLFFSHESRMRTSLKDTIALQKYDVEALITSKAGASKVEIHTKPIRLVFELSQMDDVLSRSGGLSSLLELGSSVASSSTVRDSPRNFHERRVEPRGVRFEDPPGREPRPYDDLNFGLGKLNIRMGGVGIDIVGSESILKATSSAVKVVYRTEGLGMQIDRISLQGPFLLGANESPELSVNLQNTRLEYLPVPNDKDLDRLLAILTPSKDKYDADDDIMVDTLLRQRRKGGVLRLTVMSFMASLEGMSHMVHLSKVATELGKLSKVAKYLPEDDRPGILSLALVKNFEFDINMGDPIGKLHLQARALEGAHVSVPSLLAAQIATASIRRNDVEILLDEAITCSGSSNVPPMVMCRFVADEMDPTVKLKLFNICFEYRAALVAALMNTADSFSGEGSEAGSERSLQSLARTSSPPSSESAAEFVRRTNISIAIRDSALALNPRDVQGRALVILTDAAFASPLNDSKDIKVSTDIKKASIMVIDKVNVDGSPIDPDRRGSALQSEDQVRTLTEMGYVPIGYISSATSNINVTQLDDNGNRSTEVDFGNALLILESCADSTQTLLGILNGLSPPAPPVKVSPYRTEIMPIEDLLASFSGDAFVAESGPESGLRVESSADSESRLPGQQDIEYVSEFYQPDPDDSDDISESGLHSEMLDSEIAESTVSISVAPVSIKESVAEASHTEAMTNSLLDFRDEHFGDRSTAGDDSHRWDATRNTYGLAGDRSVKRFPLKVRIRGVHVIWNLFDGYDWQGTRDIISEAVKDIETRAAARRPRSASRLSPGTEEEEESVIGDFLFNSIYIGIPANKDSRELAGEINRDIDDLTSESGSYATSTTITGSPARDQPLRQKQKRLKLQRSKQHKMTFELKGISADMLVFPPGSGEVQSSVDIRVKDLDIFDHVPTSTWKKFATYMRDAGEREACTSMIHIEILNVRPVPDLAATEMILKLTVLPLRLHVDQDALDFMSRFFEFKDERAPAQSATTSPPPFLQRVEVNPIKIKLDFKPKRVDYGGLRSGRTTEFMNFFVLDQADMILRRVILYGVSGFDRLGIMLNNIWTPDVRRNQLPGILAGLAPIRSLVNVGSGVKDLVVVPMREYQKDGRIVRSIQKGALAFAKTTSKELIGLGAKLAIGTQTVLQNAETMLAPPDPASNPSPRDDQDEDAESRKQISLYADQPIGVVQGLRGAYASLERDLLLAKDAIIAVPGEVMASGSAAGAAKAVLKQAPTAILRPAIGASKAVGKTLLGAGNTLDRENWRRVEEKYKRH
ncbi:hypothetical protein EPUS_07728 [Endocarpon pusillum Z07020]|uniref:Autophagy-related protein 2 n=1 Tax=Endocarpon pusillum (strain Z07020 / HMAS-L-300199) TaxID=1263415 RepID=U1GMM6_ENDPU|nr:uncharacterized protein EPUS_07728 [Endocarpon pusillum Z07020]ERF73523.1 hypothetical protein EPUS_07728 [Endocarpon pusillum Z07020]